VKVKVSGVKGMISNKDEINIRFLAKGENLEIMRIIINNIL
jgi:hypothetical protein